MTTNQDNNQRQQPVSITPSGFFGNSSEMIHEIPDFMTEDELAKLQIFARNNTVWDVTETHVDEDGVVIYEADYWKDRVATYQSLVTADPEIPTIIGILVQRLKPIIENFFSVEADPTSPAIVRWLPGQLQMPHADKELHEGNGIGPGESKPNDFPYYDLASLFYINDDYEGGELYFPQHGIQFKPKPGAAYFFPGDKNYVHGVTEITSGIRYTCPFFWTITKHVPKEN
jgi:predicted 2-oxoglutarate/Fe(II)-dependent dioxygenase YbiX